jgi:hypothetical protein
VRQLVNFAPSHSFRSAHNTLKDRQLSISPSFRISQFFSLISIARLNPSATRKRERVIEAGKAPDAIATQVTPRFQRLEDSGAFQVQLGFDSIHPSLNLFWLLLLVLGPSGQNRLSGNFATPFGCQLLEPSLPTFLTQGHSVRILLLRRHQNSNLISERLQNQQMA